MGNRILDTGGGGHEPPDLPPKPPNTKGPTGGSPGLLTSTGGLFGVDFLLILPIVDTQHNTGQFYTLDPTDFNSEEDTTYVFKQEEQGHLKQVTVHKVLVTYKDLGKVKVTFSITSYSSENDKYTTKSQTVTLGSAKADEKLHGKKVDLVITGERPQLSIFRKANAGPMAITKITMVGNSSEEQQV